MSDNWLIFVASPPEWQPSASTDRAVEMVRQAFPKAEAVEAQFHDAIQFIDQGQNFEDVKCPECGKSVMEGFGDLMDGAHDEGVGGFIDLIVDVPCCGQRVSLDELEFEMPAAFGRFQIDVMSPEFGEVPTGLQDAVETELGTPVRIVWCHI